MSSIMTTYAPSELSFEKGDGVYLYTPSGKKYLDFCSGIAVSSLGHNHPHLVKAIKNQAEKLLHYSNLYTIPTQEKVADRLTQETFASSVFFCNSGAEAVECGIKVARKFHHENGNPKRTRIVTAVNSFHGRTMATLSAAKQEKHMAGFGPMLEGFDQVAFDNPAALRKQITDETAAILVEPIQGEGGINSASDDYLDLLRKIADEFEILLFIDEVQTGMGRTGKLFAYEWSNVQPDIMATAKGLGGGFPVGACLANEKVSAAMSPGNHGSTFGGNPMAMAATNAVLDVVLERNFFSHVQAMSTLLKKNLENLSSKFSNSLGNVRGKGLLIGLECKASSSELVKAFENNGLLTVAASDNVVRFLPPLIVESEHIEEATLLAHTACSELYN